MENDVKESMTVVNRGWGFNLGNATLIYSLHYARGAQ